MWVWYHLLMGGGRWRFYIFLHLEIAACIDCINWLRLLCEWLRVSHLVRSNTALTPHYSLIDTLLEAAGCLFHSTDLVTTLLLLMPTRCRIATGRINVPLVCDDRFVCWWVFTQSFNLEFSSQPEFRISWLRSFRLEFQQLKSLQLYHRQCLP